LPLDRARTAALSPRNDLVKNCRVHPTHWLISTQLVTRLYVALLVAAPSKVYQRTCNVRHNGRAGRHHRGPVTLRSPCGGGVNESIVPGRSTSLAGRSRRTTRRSTDCSPSTRSDINSVARLSADRGERGRTQPLHDVRLPNRWRRSWTAPRRR